MFTLLETNVCSISRERITVLTWVSQKDGREDAKETTTRHCMCLRYYIQGYPRQVVSSPLSISLSLSFSRFARSFALVHQPYVPLIGDTGSYFKYVSITYKVSAHLDDIALTFNRKSGIIQK